MSHYCVAVFYNKGQDPEWLLAPYSENDEAYFQKVRLSLTKKEVEEKYRKDIYRNRVMSFEEWMNDNGIHEDDEGLYTYENPNAKWDYYSLGARDYMYDTKPSQTMDEDSYDFRKSQIDFGTKKKKYVSPYAYITPDGVWHSPGTVGWFGTADDTEESREAYEKGWIDYINSTDDDPYVSICDCHI